jgi:hypothetical protein
VEKFVSVLGEVEGKRTFEEMRKTIHPDEELFIPVEYEPPSLPTRDDLHVELLEREIEVLRVKLSLLERDFADFEDLLRKYRRNRS